jgi:hypothetical protein
MPPIRKIATAAGRVADGSILPAELRRETKTVRAGLGKLI